MATKMTDKLFWAIKVMLEGKATHAEIAKYFNIGSSTVSRVKASENLDEYFAIIAAMGAKIKAKAKEAKAQEAKQAPALPAKPENAQAPVQTIEHRQTVTLQATHYMQCEMHKQTEVLELISRKLTATMEAVTALLDCWKNS